MGIGRDVDALAAVPLFRDLSDAQRNELIALVRDLDKLNDLGKLTAILAAARAN